MRRSAVLLLGIDRVATKRFDSGEHIRPAHSDLSVDGSQHRNHFMQPGAFEMRNVQASYPCSKAGHTHTNVVERSNTYPFTCRALGPLSHHHLNSPPKLHAYRASYHRWLNGEG